MKRSSWMSVVDALAFISFTLLIGTGVLIRYVLPPGSGRLIAEGGGWRAAQRPVGLVWGLTRHEWGGIHFWIAVTFLVVVGVHLFIHWRWIVVSFRGRDRQRTYFQVGLGIAALAGVLILTLAPLFAPKQSISRRDLQGLRGLETEQLRRGHGRGQQRSEARNTTGQPEAETTHEADMEGR